MIQQYESRPIVVIAIQFTRENKNQVYSWAIELQGNVTALGNEENPMLKIPTLEGEMTLNVGDYLVKEPFPTDWRKLYPVKKEIFEARYKLLD